jgi:hypothetical protein
MARHKVAISTLMFLTGLVFSFAAVGGSAQPIGGASVQTAPGSASTSSSASLTPAEAAAGWKLLFDGKSLSGWSPSGTADWKVSDGTLTFTTGRGTLATTQSFSNFELRLEFWAAKDANSGVFLRCAPAGNGNACYEINIFDSHETAPTGSIINLQPGNPPAVVHSVLPDRPTTAEKWNTYDITADGTHLVIKVNGKTTSDVREEKLKLVSGSIQLQAGGPDGPGIAKFRNIRIRTF